jgi:hypothetical protein
MINIFLALDMNQAEIIGMYKEKNKLNYKRQEDSELGYVQKAELKGITKDSQH